jgi:large subunit ribosomal protein L30
MKQKELTGKLVVAIRIRGRVNVRSTVEETLQRLRLKRINNCVLIRVNEPYLGMLKKCMDKITYGEVDEPTLQKMIEKFELNVDPKALISGKANLKDISDKMPMRLHPPKHGHAGVKRHINQGGSLGYDKEGGINELIGRMV